MASTVCMCANACVCVCARVCVHRVESCKMICCCCVVVVVVSCVIWYTLVARILYQKEKNNKGENSFFVYVLFCFCFVLFFETGFLCIALAVLELTL